jgi:hypothetical protein
MPFRKSPSMDRTGVERIAEGWGKVVARRVHEEVGPDRDLDADDIEQVAAVAARAVARGTIADLLARVSYLATYEFLTCFATKLSAQRNVTLTHGVSRVQGPGSRPSAAAFSTSGSGPSAVALGGISVSWGTG